MSESAEAAREPVRIPLGTMAVGLWGLVLSGLVILGADLLWAVALGDTIRADGTVPEGIPFASAPQAGWHNPIVLAQLVLSVVHGWGPAALAALQVVIVVATLLVVVADARAACGREPVIALVVSLVAVGASAAFVVTRLPSLSLVPFVLVVAIMRSQARNPDRGIWWLVPIFVLWGNLHGAVLVGLAVLGVFLVVSRGGGSLWRRAGIGAGSASALLLTSAGLDTPAYYLSALSNEAAARGTDLWARPDLSHPLDLVMVLVILVLLVMAVRRQMPLWEWVVVAGLALGTLSAARNGVWLVLFLAAASARRPQVARTAARSTGFSAVAVGSMLACAAAAAWQLTARLDSVAPPGTKVVGLVRNAAHGQPVLADEPLAETLAQAGITVWAANPIDAFPRAVQGEFLDFLHGDGAPPSAQVGLAAVDEDLAHSLVGWTEVGRSEGYVLMQPSD